ncbi:MAG: hypothetical protein ABFQ65_03130 [Nanoarchaeota archaeon]
MRKSLIVCGFFFILCLSLVSAEILHLEKNELEDSTIKQEIQSAEYSTINPFYCGAPCKQVVEGSPVWCSDEYTFGQGLVKKDFCWRFNSPYCNFSCVNESQNTFVKKVCPDLTGLYLRCITPSGQSLSTWCENQKNWKYYTDPDSSADEDLYKGDTSCSKIVIPFSDNQQICGDGICAEIEKEEICKNKEICYPACYSDCGIIKQTFGSDSAREIEFFGTPVTKFELDEGECEGSICLKNVNLEGVEITYNDDSIFIDKLNEPYFVSQNSAYIVLTTDSLFIVRAPSEEFIEANSDIISINNTSFFENIKSWFSNLFR